MRRTGVIFLATGDDSQHDLLTVSRWHLTRHHPEIDQFVVSDRAISPQVGPSRNEPSALFGSGQTTVLRSETARGLASRSFKTRLAEVSPFECSLFLDNDAILARRIDPIWRALDQNPLAVAVDVHGRVGQAVRFALDAGLIGAEEADVTKDVYGEDGLCFSTGVLLWRRCLQTDRFFEVWHEEWRRFQGHDKFPFARALARTGLSITVLPRSFNQPVAPDTPDEDIRRAKILHFWHAPKLEQVRERGYFPGDDRVSSNSEPNGRDAVGRTGDATRPRLCVICPTREHYSETFIRAHIERLPAEVSVFYGGSYPFATDVKPKLARFLIECQAEAVLAEFGFAGVAAMDICQRIGLPLTVHFHGVDAHHHGVIAPLRREYEQLFRSADAVVAVSRRMLARLQELKAPPSKLHFNPHGVDVSVFSGAEPAMAPPTFVAVGRFVDKKSPQLTILAFRDVVMQCADARLVMIGDGPLLESCRSLAHACGIADSVKLLGARPHADVATVMRSARSFVQHSVETSYGDSEGTPVAVLEAGASGLPVVATKHAGIQDVVIDGQTGFLVNEGDVESMGKHMLRLARDSDLAAIMGVAARNRITAEFSLEKSIAGLWRIIQSTLRAGKGTIR